MALIREDIQAGVNSIVVAGCSQRFMTDNFSFDDVLTTRVNLREQVVWCQPKGEEDTQMMAEDYLRMGLTKVGIMEPLEPFQPEEEMSKKLLVVGGGLASLDVVKIFMIELVSEKLKSLFDIEVDIFTIEKQGVDERIAHQRGQGQPGSQRIDPDQQDRHTGARSRACQPAQPR